MTHSSFAQWRDLKLLGFSKRSSYQELESGVRGTLNLLPDNWIPCNNTNDEYVKLLKHINISAVEVDDETFAWYLGVDVPSNVPNPWKKRLQRLCEAAKNSNSTDQRELLKQIDKIANVVRGSDKILRGNYGLKGIDQEIIDEFPELAKFATGLSQSQEAISSILMSIDTMELGDIVKVFQGVNLCNWKYDYAGGKFVASDETGLTDREIIVATQDEAKKLFGWNGNQFSNSDGEWNSKGFGLNDGDEMVIFHDNIVKKIEQATNISRIEMPTKFGHLRTKLRVIILNFNSLARFLLWIISKIKFCTKQQGWTQSYTVCKVGKNAH